MSTTNTITTNQFIHLELRPASIGHRIVAQIIDYFILFMYYMMILFTSETTAASSWRTQISRPVEFILCVIFFILPLFYTPLCEVLLGGQTFGKKAIGIKVIMLNGESESLSAVALRWILSIVDCCSFVLGPIVMMCNKNRQRLGDLAANCMVIKEENSKLYKYSMKEFHYLDGYTPVFEFARDLTWGQISFINKTLNGFRWNSNHSKNMIMLAKFIEKKYGVTRGKRTSREFFLTIIKDYNYYNTENTL